jgi:hypothetical protein
MRDVCLDDGLWRRFYLRDFPPCPKSVKSCLWRTSAAVADFDPTTFAESRLDRLLDPTVCESPLIQGNSAAATRGAFWALIECSVSKVCPHHWRSVMSVRGHRWAYASNMTPPRTFAAYPQLSPRLVGRIGTTNCLSGDYRGDVKETSLFFSDGWRQYLPHGLGTAIDRLDDAKAVDGHCCCISGEWRCGRAHGRAASWPECIESTHPRPPEDTSPRDRIHGYFEGDHVDGRPCGHGVLIGADVIRVGIWSSDGTCIGRSWRTVVADIRLVPTRALDYLSGIGASGSSTLSGHETGAGLVRTGDGIVAFCGDVHKGRPAKGRAFDLSGSLIYEGEFGPHGINGKGTLYLADGRLMKSDTWKQTYCTETHASNADEAVPCLLATIIYPNGDTIECQWTEGTHQYGGTPPPVVGCFGYSQHDADAAVAGSHLSSPLGWQAVVPGRHDLDPSPQVGNDEDSNSTSSMMPALEHTHLFALCYGQLGRRRWIADFVFWPCVYPRGFDYPDVDVAIQFVEHMTSRHSEWAPYRSAIYSFYGLEPPLLSRA